MTTLAIPLDTFKLAEKFQETGFTKPQAQALVEAIRPMDTELVSHRRDLDDIKTDIKIMRADIAAVKSTLDNLPYWFTGAMFAQGGLIIAILQLLR